MPSLHTAISEATKKLSNSDTPRLDAEILLCHVLGVARSYLYTWPEKILTSNQDSQFKTLLARRAQAEPIAYLTGHKEFWSLDLQVSKKTLIPRPETELLVEQALIRLPPDKEQSQTQTLVIDLGTGSGAIALAIAQERPRCRILATDKSIAALTIARNNAQTLGLQRIEFLQSDWCTGLGVQKKARLIVSNPPYISATDSHLNQGELLYEPRSALIAGKDGLADIRQIIKQAPFYLETQGWLLLEHGYEQAQAVQNLFKQHAYHAITTYQDLAGHPRVTVGQIGGTKSSTTDYGDKRIAL